MYFFTEFISVREKHGYLGRCTIDCYLVIHDFSLDKEGLSISNQGRSIVRLSTHPSDRPCFRSPVRFPVTTRVTIPARSNVKSCIFL